MTLRLIAKPEAGEFAPYTRMYLDLLPDDGRVLQHLQDNLQTMYDLVVSLDETLLVTAHRPGEWTIKEILVHIIDDERIYAYRALRFARHDVTELPGFEQDDYVPQSYANERSIESIMTEYAALRQSTIALFANVPDDALLRQGIGSGNPLSVRAAAYHIAGHELHHIHSIKENYLR